MAIWTSIAKMFRSREEPVSQEDLAKLLGGEDTWTGLDVDRYTALGLPVVWACVRVLAETLASLPLILYKRTDGGKERADAHPLYPILHIQPNPEQTAFVFKEQLQHHLGIFGNAYAQIVRDGRGYVKELWPLDPSLVKPFRDERGLRFTYKKKDGAEEVTFEKNEILFIPALSFNGIQGYAPLEINKQTLGLALAAKRYAAEFFANNATPSLALVSPGKLTEEAAKRMAKSWRDSHGKWGKKGTPAVLEQGIEIKTLSAEPEKVQLVEIQKYLTREVCRFYRMQPHMVQDLENATFTNIEHQGLEFVTHTIRPWLVRWEQAITTQLLTEKERKEYFCEFLIDALLRGDIVARSTAYRTFMEMGVLNADEIREMENKNRREGGDTYYAPQNWIATAGSGLEQQKEKDALAAEQLKAQMQAPPAEKQPEEKTAQRSVQAPETRARKSADSRRKIANVFAGLIRDSVARIVRKEKRDISGAVGDYVGKRDLGDLNLWLDKYYSDLPEYIRKQITPVYSAFSAAVKKEIAEEVGGADDITDEDEKFVRSMADVFVKTYVGTSRGNLATSIKAALDAGAPLDAAIEERLAEWEEKRPDKVAAREKVGVSNAVARNLYTLAGITTLTWLAAGGDPCPFCQRLDGSTVDIKQPFVYEGEEIPEDRGLGITKNMSHPPLHAGCECQIVAGG